ncbi:MAG: hypothetical protein H5T86_15370 [Armatimonadetes bacterium]|nr:hypothetical protein [Armatimonadota bacterium]
MSAQVRQLRERLEAREKQLAELVRAQERQRLVQQFSEHEFAGKRRLPPAHAEKLAELALKLADPKDREELVKAITSLEFVELDERGFAAQPSDTEQQYEQAVRKVMEERKVSYGEAARIVAREQPELAARFYEERRRAS